jgi:hypothetical protein
VIPPFPEAQTIPSPWIQGPASDRVQRFGAKPEERDLTSRKDDQSLRGQAQTVWQLCADFPRDYPLAATTSLSVAYEEGFPVISRLYGRDHSRPGQFDYPTRNFATLGPFLIVTPSSAFLLEVADSFLVDSHGRP